MESTFRRFFASAILLGAAAILPPAVVAQSASGSAAATPDAASADSSQPPRGGIGFQAGDFTADLGGYGSFRYESSDSEDVAASFTLRRLVITTDARYRDRLRMYTEIEYERLSEIEVERGVEAEEGGLEFEQELEGANGGEIALEQAWAQFNFSPAFGVRFGAVLPPVGRFNLQHDDNLWNFPRRPLIDRQARVLPAAAAWTEMGLGIVGEVMAGEVPITYEAYVMNGVELDFAIEEKVQTRDPSRNKLLLEAVVSPAAGAFDGSNTADALAGRLAVSPALGSEVAISAYAGDYTPDYLGADASIRTIGLDGRQRIGPIVLEGEFLYTSFGDLEDVLTDFAATALDHATETEADETATLESEIEIAVTGVSDTRAGFWIDAGWPIALDRGVWGLDAATLTPVVRYERAWYDGNLEAFDFAAGAVSELDMADRRQSRISAGLAFRPVPQAVFHLVYERNDALEGALIDPAVVEGETNGVVFGMAVGF